MRTYIFYTLSIFAFMLSSCSKEQIEAPKTQQKANEKSEIESTMLSFSSEEDMGKQIWSMLVNPQTRSTAVARVEGFISQQELFEQALSELETISTIEEAEAFKERYSPFFLFNDDPVDDERFNPYLPSDMLGYSYICDPWGNVEINGKVENFNNLTSVKETEFYQASHQLASRASIYDHTNHLYIHSARKLWAEMRRGNGNIAYMNGIFVEFTTHKYTWLTGWTKCSNNYHMRYRSCVPATWRSADYYTYFQTMIKNGQVPTRSTGTVGSHHLELLGSGEVVTEVVTYKQVRNGVERTITTPRYPAVGSLFITSSGVGEEGILYIES